MESLKQQIVSLAKKFGINKIGFTSKERLENAPPSGDLKYILPDAMSAISLCIAFDKEAIRDYLSKKDQMAHINDHKKAYIRLNEAGSAIWQLLKNCGYEALSTLPNWEYRKGLPFMSMAPPLSHRYVAVAAGIGTLGWSGNLITPEYGAIVSLSSVVTSAEFEPDPLVEKNYCSNCHICARTCPSYFISGKEKDHVIIAKRVFKHNKKAGNLRCNVTCAGANGVRNLNSKWSTWSHRVLDLPGKDDDEVFENKVFEYSKGPRNRLLKIILDVENTEIKGDQDFNQFVERMLQPTCTNCMLVCWPDIKDRKENFKLLINSGRVFKDENGLKVVKSE